MEEENINSTTNKPNLRLRSVIKKDFNFSRAIGELCIRNISNVRDNTSEAEIRIIKPQINMSSLEETDIAEDDSNDKVNGDCKDNLESDCYKENYCSIKDLSLERHEPIRIITPFNIPLSAKSFKLESIYDKVGLGYDETIEYKNILLDYVERWGNTRYLYQPVIGTNEIFDDFNVNEFEKEFFLRAIHLLLIKDSIQTNFLGMANDISFFRTQVLGWIIGSGTINTPRPSVNVKLSSVSGSNVSPDFLSQAISRLNSFRNHIEDTELRYLIGDKMNGLISKIESKENELAGLLGEQSVEFIEKLKEMSNILPLFYERPLTDNSYLAINISSSHGGQDISNRSIIGDVQSGHLSTEDMEDIVNSSDPQLLSDYKEKFIRTLEYIYTFIAAIKDQYGTDIFTGVPQILEPMEVYLNHSNTPTTVFPSYEFRVPYAHNIVSDRLKIVVNKFRDYFEGEHLEDEESEELKQLKEEIEALKNDKEALEKYKSDVDTGLVFMKFTDFAAEVLKRNHKQIKKINSSNPLIPLVLGQRLGKYREIPKNKWRLYKIPSSRRGNFLDPSPFIGVLKEYSLGVKHIKFGVGDHVYSKTLFPGEEVEMEIKSVSKEKTEESENSAHKIFKGEGSEIHTDLNEEFQDEYSKSTANSKSEDAGIKAEASGGFGPVSASVSAHYNWSASSEENNASKAMSNTTTKLANKLSDKQEITIDTSASSTTTSEFELDISKKRKFQNTNRERTLTFNFFQITREEETRFNLEDLYFYYTSGKFNLIKIFANIGFFRLLSEDEEARNEISEMFSSLNDQYDLSDEDALSLEVLETRGIIEKVPLELTDHFEEDALIFILAEPFQQKLPLSLANSFLASIFNKDEAVTINKNIWSYIGSGKISPEGLNVGAFPMTKDELENNNNYDLNNILGANINTFEWEVDGNIEKLIADKIIDKKDDEAYLLANIDLRYKQINHFRTKFLQNKNQGALPLLIHRKRHIIKTQGLYAENMLGQCPALEQFAIDHRRLDVESKEIENKKQRLMLPPDKDDFMNEVEENGEIKLVFNEDSYNKAFSNYIELVKANTPISNTKEIDSDSTV